MPERTIPTDKVREIIARHRDGASHRGGMILNDLKALLPTPPRPTLADMTEEERRACKWMQADAEGYESRVVIVNPYWEDGIARVMWPGAHMRLEPHRLITPRPDLPRMEWPGTEKPAPTPALPEGWRLADHKGYGRGIVTNPTPNRDGHVYFVIPDDDPMGFDWRSCDPDMLTYLDQEADTSDAAPPNTLAVGSKWDNVDALARACEESGRDQIVVADKDGDVFVWGVYAEWWETGVPGCDYAPHTIIHAGKEADQ